MFKDVDQAQSSQEALSHGFESNIMKNKKVKQSGAYPNILEQDSHTTNDENEVKQY